jgi:hypothetical protein
MRLMVSTARVSKSRSSGVIITKRVLAVDDFFQFAFRRWCRKPEKMNKEDAVEDISNSLSAKSRIINLLSKLPVATIDMPGGRQLEDRHKSGLFNGTSG